VSRPTRADASGQAYLELQNLSRREGRHMQALLVLYVLERFLARLAVTEHADRFVLKGGMLLAGLQARRATVDADFLATQLANDEATVLAHPRHGRARSGTVTSTPGCV
jgi:Nucleotidyl transferase AbiEii toxin, Type IV TA system